MIHHSLGHSLIFFVTHYMGFIMIHLRRLLTLSFCTCMYFIGALSAVEDSLDNSFLNGQETLYISLGSDCQVAHYSRLAEVRKGTFPFDWMLTVNTSSVSRLIRDNFEYSLEEGFFEKHSMYDHVMVNNYYGIEYRHEWTSDLGTDFSNYKERMEDIQLKYQRRVERFSRLADYKGKVFFIRVAFNPKLDSNMKSLPKEQLSITHADAVELRDAIKERFPNLDFKLVIANYTEVMKAPLNVEGVLEFKLSRLNDEKGILDMFNQLKNIE